jgi:hypothetical protein
MSRCAGWFLGMLLFAFAGVAADRPFLDVQGETGRTAIWVGDRFHYTITVVHDSQVRLVTDNLQKSTLNLEPFEVLDLQYRESPAASGRKKLEIDILLTTYETEPREIEIPGFNLFYFLDSTTAAASSDRPAETLAVPPVAVVLRGTVPENASSIRDGFSTPSVPLRQRVARPLAIGMAILALLLVTPLFLHGKKLHASQELARRRKRAEDELRFAAGRLAARPVDSEARMAEFYDEANQTLRSYLSAVSILPTEGKTPRELAKILANGGSAAAVFSSGAARDLVEVLQACERVRYASDAVAAGRDQHSGVVERLRSLAAAL